MVRDTEKTSGKEKSSRRTKSPGGTDSILREWVARSVRDAKAAHWASERLSPILAYDQCHGTELAATLRAYLDCDRSKQRTAARLYVHRQTLYHRLGQIGRLLQADLDDPLQRILLHAYLYNSAETDR